MTFARRHVKYEAAGGDDASSNLSLDVNGPRFILAADPLYALMDFAALDDDLEEDEVDSGIPDERSMNDRGANSLTSSAKKPESSMSIQMNVSDAAVLLLASDSVKNTELIELRIAQMVLTKQVNYRENIIR
jgi:vacuolar protein sorting-associated protein 13A/C